MLITVLVIWGVAVAVVVAVVAQRHGRHPFLWFGLSVVLSPIIALLLLIVELKPDAQAPTREKKVRPPRPRETAAQEARRLAAEGKL